MSNPSLTIKRGDTIPVQGRISIVDEGVDVTEDEDFSLWEISCELRDKAGVLVHDLAITFIAAGPVFADQVASSVTDTLTEGATYYLDVRFKQPDGTVSSSGTQTIKILKPISETPT